MKILALETSLSSASIAIADGSDIVLQQQMPPGDRTAVWLAEAIREALARCRWSRTAVELIGLTSGPGSFTGLRIGVTTAKLLAYAWQVPVVELDTLHVIAAGAVGSAGEQVSVAIDARRGELFASTFQHDDEQWQVTEPTRVISEIEWLTSFDRYPRRMATGPVLEKLGSRLPDAIRRHPPTAWYPTAANVASMAQRAMRMHGATDPVALLPRYFRPSYAERGAS